jgi:hypothetical protein
MFLARPAALLVAAAMLAACAAVAPYRSARPADVSASRTPACQKLYVETDAAIAQIAIDPGRTYDQRQAALASEERNIRPGDKDQAACWRTAHERHGAYDLLYAEFDDSGWPTDTSYDPALGAADSQIRYIEGFLRRNLDSDPKGKENPGYDGLNIVVFTHGWHHKAAADDDNSLQFKGMLQDLALREGERVQRAGAGGAPAPLPRRVVGIEIAWRGDSFLHFGIPGVNGSENALNVWDRKGAAETVATGSVHDLVAFLHEFYLAHSCHERTEFSRHELQQCGQVHMLTVGHSFGALIDFRALVARLESGLHVAKCHLTYGFGDLTVLLNPAFEGARYEGVFASAVNREDLYGPYAGSPAYRQQCAIADTRAEAALSESDRSKRRDVAAEEQLPALVILQSKGDTATSFFFPIMRELGTRQRTLSDDERIEKNQAVGWVARFRTHQLSFNDGADDLCDYGRPPALQHCPFLAREGARPRPPAAGRHFKLQWNWGAAQLAAPAYMPVWDVFVDDPVMENHDDIWNPQIVTLISDMYEDAYTQADRFACARDPSQSAQACAQIRRYRRTPRRAP